MLSEPDRNMKYIQKKTSQKKEQNKKSKQIEIIDQKIKDTKGLRQQAVQAIKLLEQESVPCADRREKEYDILLVSKGMALKRKGKKRQI